jgi:hypothetical protein
MYFMAVLYILWPFGIFDGDLVYFSPLGHVAPIKIWQPSPRLVITLLRRRMDLTIFIGIVLTAAVPRDDAERFLTDFQANVFSDEQGCQMSWGKIRP